MHRRIRVPGLAALVVVALMAPSQLHAQTADEWARQRLDLTDQQMRGRGLFLQRCSMCHLPQGRRLRSAPPRPYGLAFHRLAPELIDVLKAPTPEKEAMVRRFIVEGGPKMPAFKYALDAKDVDDLIAFLKTLRRGES